jgi:hypothetical protein
MPQLSASPLRLLCAFSVKSDIRIYQWHSINRGSEIYPYSRLPIFYFPISIF